MKLILKILTTILNLIFAIFKLLPVQNKVVFISRQSNEKTEDIDLLGNALKKKSPELEIVYLCRKLEGNLLQKIGYCFHMLTQMYHIATSKVVVLDSYCICVSVLRQRKSLVVIQMWHALGSLKKFGLSIVGVGEGSKENLADAMAMHKNYTFVMTSGQACVPHFAEAFGYEESKLRVMPLPRIDRLNDHIFREDTCSKILTKYPEFQGKKVIVYAPTFRKNKDISAEIDALSSQFDKNEYAFVVKPHPLMQINCQNAEVDRDFTTLEMLFAADYVICDYSAIVFEAAILTKPLFFYTFDYENYGVDRDFYLDYKKEMPGIISNNPEEIAAAVRNNNYNLKLVEEFCDRYVQYKDDCTEKLANFILTNIN